MNLQDVFYLVAIIYMAVGILLLLGVVIILFYIKKKIGDLTRTIETKINRFVEPAEAALGMGGAIADGAFKTIKRFMNGRDKKKR